VRKSALLLISAFLIAALPLTSTAVEKGELFLFKAGVTHYELRLLPEGLMLLYLEPDRWQGNSDVYKLLPYT
jgi:hypothetical protein